MEKVKAGGVIQNIELAKICLKSSLNHSSAFSAVLCILGDKGINIQFIVQSVETDTRTSMSFCVEMDDLDATLLAIEEVRGDTPIEVTYHLNMAVISVFGPHFRDSPGIAGLFFSSLTSAGITILATSTSISSISCIVNDEQLDEAVCSLREVFRLSESHVFTASRWLITRSEPAGTRAT
jgi:aspartate kinase